VHAGAAAYQPTEGFVDEGGRLQRLAGPHLGQFLGRQLAQLLVDQRQELLGSVRVALETVAERMWVTSLIQPRITVQKVAGKNGHPTTVFARFGLLDRSGEVKVRSAQRSDTPTQYSGVAERDDTLQPTIAAK
jgi:hypothetical protein